MSDQQQTTSPFAIALQLASIAVTNNLPHPRESHEDDQGFVTLRFHDHDHATAWAAILTDTYEPKLRQPNTAHREWETYATGNLGALRMTVTCRTPMTDGDITAATVEAVLQS